MKRVYRWKFVVDGAVLALGETHATLEGMQKLIPEGSIELNEKAWPQLGAVLGYA